MFVLSKTGKNIAFVFWWLKSCLFNYISTF